VSNVAKLAVPILLVAAAAGGAFYFLNQGDTTPVAPPSGNTPAVRTPEDQTPEKPEVVEVVKPVTQPQRVEAAGANNAHSNAAQGVKGKVFLPNGQPAIGVTVMLLENAMSNPIDMFLKNKTGQVSPPLASSVTFEDGSFALGVLKAGESVDLRVVSDAHPEVAKSPLKVRSGDWYDAGDLNLVEGLVVQGRVVELLSKAPVANATVYLNSTNRTHAMSATPGRERGIAAITDGAGNYRFDNAPTTGLINLKVEADGYASTNLLSQQIRADAPNQFNLEIEQGRTITGVVVDDAGKRISGAKVIATGHSSKTPQTETVYCDDEGEFAFAALRSGPYRLQVSAKRFADVQIPLALTDEDLKVVMPKRGSVRLKVLTKSGRAVKSYRLSLKRSFPNNPNNIGNVMDFPDRSINPGDYRGQWATIDGLPSGLFRFQLMERNHAKTLSETFTVEQGADPIEVVVVLTTGGEITGTVIDDQGQPVAGATVASDMNAGLAANTGIFEMFRSMIPEKHTTRNVKTDRQGRFRITKLSFADYMLRVSHPTYCEGSKINIKLTQEGEVVDAGVIQLEKGTLVEGITTIDGNPAGQVKVVISIPAPVGQPVPTAQPNTPEAMAEAARRLFSTKSLSDGDGRYVMLKRVPPGTYKVTAARHSTDNPFMALLDMKQSEQILVVAPGQERATVNFNLSSR
tara:strand:- start:15526 stop:17586 length:2061 start_codon:yes stop_codon:yes gene_type:complete